MRQEVITSHGTAVLVLDSISESTKDDAHRIIVCGSHGGAFAGEYAAKVTPRFVSFNDAGDGKEHAGTSALAVLDVLGIPACVVRNTSARIGDGLDHWESGIVSKTNDAGKRLRICAGESIQDAVSRFETQRQEPT